MRGTECQFDRPRHALHGSYLAKVVAVDDPDGLSRVQVRLLNCDAVEQQDGPIWARVAVPFAGADRGAFFLPDVGDEVLVNFVQNDPRLPVVVGGVWNGADAPPETLGGAGDRIDRWTIVGKAGTRIAIIEENASEETVIITTPGGVRGELTDAGGGKVEFEAAGSTVTLDSNGVSITTEGDVTVQGAKVDVTASSTVNVDATMAKFSGTVKCDTLIATSVVGTTYTPGAGNVW